MHLFNRVDVKITKQEKQEILRYLDAPTLSDWNNIANLRIAPQYPLWMAVSLIKKGYLGEWSEGKIMWRSFPDAITLVRGINKAIDNYLAILEDMSFFPSPRAA